MADWQTTHGKARGAFLRVNHDMLYVRQGGRGFAATVWLIYVNGCLEGTADSETTARAAAELAVRCVSQADVDATVAAAARHLRSAT